MLLLLVKLTFGLQLNMTQSNSWKSKLVFCTLIILEVLFIVRIVERDIVTPYEMVELGSSFV